MSELIRRMAPGVAIAGVALGLVAGFDKVAQPATAAAGGSGGGSGGSSSGSSSGTSTDGCTEYTGESASTEWGPVQVVAKVSADGTICESNAVVYPDNDHRSSEINAYAVPVINEAVLAAGVEFDSVSGATYTSEAYRQSLQSILDQL